MPPSGEKQPLPIGRGCSVTPLSRCRRCSAHPAVSAPQNLARPRRRKLHISRFRLRRKLNHFLRLLSPQSLRCGFAGVPMMGAWSVLLFRGAGNVQLVQLLLLHKTWRALVAASSISLASAVWRKLAHSARLLSKSDPPGWAPIWAGTRNAPVAQVDRATAF